MNKRGWFGAALAVVVAVSAVSFSKVWAGQEEVARKQKPQPKNVILMVGDGMGRANGMPYPAVQCRFAR